MIHFNLRHLKNKLSGMFGPSIGFRYAPGSFLNTIDEDFIDDVNDTECIPENRLPPFVMVDNEKVISKQLSVVEECQFLTCGAISSIYTSFEKTDQEGEQGEKVVIKVWPAKYKTVNLRKIWYDRARREAYLSYQMNHENIVRFYDHMFVDLPDHLPGTPGALVLKMEYLDMDLSKLIAIRTLTLPELQRAAIHIGRGLDWMHERFMVHHDMKPPNVMVKFAQPIEELTRETMGAALEHAVFKIIDFNISLLYDQDRYTAREPQYSAGTHGYRCNEKNHVTDRPYNPYLADAYAFGMMLASAATGVDVTAEAYQEEYYSILPSFYRYQGTLNRNDAQTYSGLINAIEHMLKKEEERIQVNRALDLIEGRSSEGHNGESNESSGDDETGL